MRDVSLFPFFILLNIYLCACVCHGTLVKVRGQALRVSFLLPPCEFWGLNLSK